MREISAGAGVGVKIEAPLGLNKGVDQGSLERNRKTAQGRGGKSW